MTTLKTRALVLKWLPYSDHSQIVTVFTRDFGRLAVLARGALRLAKRSAAFPAPFDHAGWYDLMFRERAGELQLALEARLIEGFDHLRTTLGSYTESCFALELLDRLFSARDPHPELLRGTLSYLKLLELRAGRPTLSVHFQSLVLRESGVLPDWLRCADCGAELVHERRVEFRVPVGPICPACRAPKDVPVAYETLEYLAREGTIQWGYVPSLKPSSLALESAAWLLRSLLLYHLGAAPRSMRHVCE
ncbi:MAG: DNA repair protein RecO [Planctomycetota bacterium]